MAQNRPKIGLEIDKKCILYYLDVFAVELADPLDFRREAIESPCLIKLPFGLMENERSR